MTENQDTFFEQWLGARKKDKREIKQREVLSSCLPSFVAGPEEKDRGGKIRRQRALKKEGLNSTFVTGKPCLGGGKEKH